jgi:hypothetical protein
MRGGWSVKALHRRLVLSNTYRQRSDHRPDVEARDQSNTLYGRFNRRRLDFESMRDALLASSGALDPVMCGRAVTISEPPFPPRRTVYGYIDRQNLDPVYRTFDFASPDTSSPRRIATTVPQQALFLMNSPFVIEQAKRLAALPELSTGSPEERVTRVYERLFSRAPRPNDLALGIEFIRRQAEAGPSPRWDPKAGSPAKGAAGLSPWEEYAQVLLLTNEFMFVD